jgi:Dolichyl-phosphate-mannose-protein mannosyltransferase
VRLALSPGAGRWMRRRWAGLALAALVVAAAVTRILIDRGMKAPVVLCDEFIYSGLARSLAQHGRYAYRGVPSHQSFLYPLLIAPAWLSHSMTTTYGIAKAVGASSMTLVAVPVYLWARRLVGPSHALLAAGLTLLLPAFFYSGILMTEAVFLPAFVLATLAIAWMLEEPTLVRQLAALAAVALAIGVRFQGIVLVPAIPTAVLLKLLLDWRAGVARDRITSELRRLWPIAVVLGGGVVLYVAYKQVRGEALATGLGPYQALGRLHYPLFPSTRWAVRHLAELGLALGLVPIAALIVLAWLALTGKPTSNAERSFLAVVPAAMLWVLAEVGAFAATVTPFVFERYTFYLEPLLLIAFVLWLARGLPRPRVGTAVALAIPILLILSLNLNRVIVPDPVNGVTVDSLYKFSLRHLPGTIDELRWAIFAGAALAAFLFALCARAVARVALPVLLAAYLGAASVPALRDMHAVSRTTRAAVGADESWVVRAVGRDNKVIYVNTPTRGVSPSTVLLETEFWNPNVVGVYNVGAAEICPLPATTATTNVATGRIEPPVPQSVDYGVVDGTVPFGGRLVAAGGPPDQRLALYRVGRSFRVGEITSGIYGDGWMGGAASYTRYAGSKRSRGRLTVTISRTAWAGPDVPGHVVIRVGRPSKTGPGLSRVYAVRRWTVHRLLERSFAFDEPTPPLRATVTVDPTFSPAQFPGQTDSRQLGAVVTFAYEPRR